MGKFVELDSRGNSFRAYHAESASGKGPGILLLHPWWGLSDVFTGLADRLAAEGFTVVAPDAFNGQVATTIEQADALSSSADSEVVSDKDSAALDYLLANVQGQRVGAIGFSFGAAHATWLATRRPEIAAVVVFYGASEWNADYHKNAKAPLQGHWASNDEYESTEALPELENNLKAANIVVDFHTYPDTRHWFFEPNRPEYNADASQLAWERTLAFFREHLG